MSVHRYRGAWRSADAVGLEQVRGRDHGRHGPDFGHCPSPVFRGAEPTQREDQPLAAVDCEDERGRPGGRLGQGQCRKVLHLPEQRSRRQRSNLLLGRQGYGELLLRQCTGRRRCCRPKEEQRNDAPSADKRLHGLTVLLSATTGRRAGQRVGVTRKSRKCAERTPKIPRGLQIPSILEIFRRSLRRPSLLGVAAAARSACRCHQTQRFLR